jgi:phosphoglycolate phosphatase-like HAD superfamily hydrolase
MSLRAALFWDLDGTLLLTGRAGLFAFEEALHEVTGVHADLRELPTPGLTDAGVARLVLEHAGQTATPERIDAVLRTYERRLPASLPRRKGRVLEGIREVLEDLEDQPDVRSFLLTGNTPAGARAKLGHYDLDRFFPEGEGAFCVDHGSRTDIARRALPLAEGADHAYVIGDTPADVECGKAIGARTIAVATGWHSLDELAALKPWQALPRIPEPGEFRRLLGLGEEPPVRSAGAGGDPQE